MKFFRVVTYIGSIFIAQGAGGIGSLFTFSQISGWYASLIKPSFNPPNTVFGPVWTLLFFLMGISSAIIITSKKKKKNIKRNAMCIYFFQLSLNVLWSILFFGLHNPLFAFIDIIFLWGSICITIILFIKINRIAGLLLVPYILWVSFATILNGAIVVLNK